MLKGLVERGKVVLRLCHILAVIMVVAGAAGLSIMPAAAMPVTEGYSSAGISTGCPCSGAGSAPTATPTPTPTPVPQVVDQGISTDDQQAGCPCSSGGNTVQPSPSAVPVSTVASAADQQAATDNIPAGTAGQPASVTPAGGIQANGLKGISFPSLFGSTASGAGELSSVRFKSFAPSWLKTGETAGEMQGDGIGTSLIGRLKSPQLKSMDSIGSMIGSRLQAMPA
ncbi:hypothetical protein [Methanocella sp. MCL-LM]|uniref:hypothetical protein n=1 Tax=Methanocella sp. MCL-LM TaxID=3412035 RepID=UPI003C75D291